MKTLFLLTIFIIGFNPIKTCHEEWYNQCKEHDDCCTQSCERKDGWEFGVCMKKKCHDEWYNQCKSDSDCCSKNCERRDGWEFGVCMKAKNCLVDGSNKCENNVQCCSQFCDKPPEWQFGICKQDTAPKCLKSQQAGCDKVNCCDGLKCYDGPDSTWVKGVCIEEKLLANISKIIDKDKNKDNEEPIDNYQEFVKNYLLDQNGIIFENSKVKCREIDPKGSYFYRFDQEYSFRICDACKELPLRKVDAIRIEETPINTINSTTFDQCFGECADNKKCVACSFDKYQGQCQLFDTIQGNYEELEDWQTVVIPQPVDVLRDYVYSRNTMLKCVENSTEVHHADSILECFALCEKTNCSLAEFSPGSCTTVRDQEDCYKTFYKYGHTSLFYRDFFGEDISWRFNVTDEQELGNGQDQTTVETDDTPVVHATKTGSVSSAKLLSELKMKQGNQYLKQCQMSCLSVTTCIGVNFNKDDYTCKLIDLSNFDSLNANLGKNNTKISLIHPLKISTIYGFATQVIARYDHINYETMSKVKITDCINECKKNDKCKDILYNYPDQTCLINGDFIGTNQRKVENNDKWVMISKNRPSFNQPEFKLTLIGRNKQLANQHDHFITLKQSFPKSDQEGLNKCLKLCLDKDNSDNCDLVQVKRSKDSIECNLYKINLFNQTINSEDILFSNLYLVTLNKNFNQSELDEMPLFTGEDANNCEIDKESILIEMLYLSSVNNSMNVSNGLIRHKRGFLKSIGNFFKGVGKAIKDTVVNTVETIKGGVKAVGKLVKGDPKGALKEIKKTPLYKEGENLVKNVKTIGEGIVKGDIKKVGKGLLGVATNDLLGFIPGQKALGIAAKGIKNGVKNVIKKGSKSAKDDIVEKSSKKKNKGKSDKDEERDNKSKQCKPKNTRTKRATGKRKRDDCDDDDNSKCPRPQIKAGNVRQMDKNSLDSCTNSRVYENCNYMCDAGYYEKPGALVCEKKGKWNTVASCEPQDCAPGGYIFVESSTIRSVLDDKKGNNNVLLYLVKFDASKKLPIYSVVYHKFALTFGKFNDRANGFKNHPCKSLAGKQATNLDYSSSNPHGFHKGHLTPADLFRWNRKSGNSGNLLINVAPQSDKLNMGSWKALEAGVQCASKKEIKAIVATGISGTSQYKIGGGVQVPKYFWKMVCYRDKRSLKAHVVLFIGDNKPIKTETESMKKETLTPRSQKDLNTIDPSILSINNPWQGVLKMKEKFALIGRYPTAPECMAAMDLPDDQVKRWKSQFSVFGTRKKRDTDQDAFCSKEEFGEILDYIMSFHNVDGDNENETGGDDEGEQNSNVPVASCGKRIVGYYPSWGNTDVPASLLAKFTHIIFAFFEMRSDGTVALGNPDHSSTQSSAEVEKTARSKLESLMKNKAKVPGLKVLFAAGGWENSQYFSSMAADPKRKENFIASVLRAIDEYGFDGIDIDWEYPVTGGAKEGIIQDKENYVSLLKDLRGVLDAKARGRYLITFASAAGEDALKNGYNLPALLEYANWVNIMTYDFFGPWESKWGAYTGPPAPLYHNVPKGYSGKFNVNWAIKQYVCDLKSPEQVVMGVPLYGRYWHNVPDKQGDHAMYRLANPVNGKFPGGFVSWRDIKKTWLTDSNFQTHFDDKVKCPYAYNKNGTYLGYESPESIKFKIEFAIKSNLGGIMVWAIDQDDNEQSMIKQISQANLCTNDKSVKFKCIPIKEKRWWTMIDGEKMAGLCGKSAPLYRGYYPVCDPDDLGYSCCGGYGYCGSDKDFCNCPTCVNYADDPDKILAEPTKPKTDKITWHFSNAPDGQRGRCGRDVPKVNGVFATCNPDDPNANCCSDGGYCGQGDKFCKCNGCINFKERPNYTFPPKTWWSYSDDKDKSGKCGPKAPKLPNGGEAGCDPDSQNYCCSNSGYCGSGKEFCECSGCKNYKH